MTTIAIQQRAGGDTVRALGELASTLDARKDLRREINDAALAASSSRPTSWPASAARTILLINVDLAGRDPGDDVLGASGSPGSWSPMILWTIAFVLIRRTTRIDV